jgi:hypothetical protein
MNATHNARINMMATLMNNLAVAFVVAGFIAPAVSGHLDGAGRFIVALVWMLVGFGLHSVALAILGRLRQ